MLTPNVLLSPPPSREQPGSTLPRTLAAKTSNVFPSQESIATRVFYSTSCLCNDLRPHVKFCLTQLPFYPGWSVVRSAGLLLDTGLTATLPAHTSTSPQFLSSVQLLLYSADTYDDVRCKSTRRW